MGPRYDPGVSKIVTRKKLVGLKVLKQRCFGKKVKRKTPAEAYLEPSRISTMEFFCESNQRLKVVNCFRKNASL